MEEAMVLFLNQEPQQMNLYIITNSVGLLLCCILNNWPWLILRGHLCGWMAGHP